MVSPIRTCAGTWTTAAATTTATAEREGLHTGQVVLRIANVKHGVEVDTFNATTQTVERWQARRDEILAELSQVHPYSGGQLQPFLGLFAVGDVAARAIHAAIGQQCGVELHGHRIARFLRNQ